MADRKGKGMSYVLVYTILIGKLQYMLIEPMQSLSQCRRLQPIVESSEHVLEARCAGMILDGE
jgi:hypothetical protein